jgi:hypothetical protein
LPKSLWEAENTITFFHNQSDGIEDSPALHKMLTTQQ